MAFVHRHHQRARAVGAARVDVGAARNQARHDVAVAREGRVVQGAPAHRRRIDLRAAGEQQVHRRQVAAPGGVHQRLLADIVLAVHVRAAREVELHQLQVALPGADHEAGADAVGDEVHRQARIQPFARPGDVARFQARAVGFGVGQRGRRRHARRQRDAERPEYGQRAGKVPAHRAMPIISARLGWTLLLSILLHAALIEAFTRLDLSRRREAPATALDVRMRATPETLKVPMPGS